MTAPPQGSLPRPSLNAGALVARSCPVCGSNEVGRIFAEANLAPEALDGFAFASRKPPEHMHYRIVACDNCDLLYCSPIPTREFLDSAYREASFDAPDESRFASATYARLLRELVRSLPDRQGALDIGTGDGAFLHQLLQYGFSNVVGVEPSFAPVALADPSIRGLIRQGPFRPSDFEGSQFRLITCFQTMEHVDDPLGLCRAAHRLLKNRGVLVVVCHNRRALSARLMGLRSPIFDIEHLQLFSPKSLKETLERAGFDEVEVHPIVNRYPIRYWARLAPLPALFKTGLLRKLKSANLERMLLSAPVGNMVAIGYRP